MTELDIKTLRTYQLSTEIIAKRNEFQVCRNKYETNLI